MHCHDILQAGVDGVAEACPASIRPSTVDRQRCRGDGVTASADDAARYRGLHGVAKSRKHRRAGCYGLDGRL